MAENEIPAMNRLLPFLGWQKSEGSDYKGLTFEAHQFGKLGKLSGPQIKSADSIGNFIGNESTIFHIRTVRSDRVYLRPDVENTRLKRKNLSENFMDAFWDL